MSASPPTPAVATDLFTAATCFVSPHLDDAVLSCAHALASHPMPEVLTVFTDAPPVERVDGWNHDTTGQSFAPSAYGIRRAEDLDALSSIGADAHWLGLIEAEYREGPADVDALADAIGAALHAHGFTSAVAPLGLRHPDHIAVSDACLTLAARGTWAWWLALDLPYALSFPESVELRLAAIRDRGFELVEVDVAPLPTIDKEAVFRRYRSQFDAVRADHPGFDEAMSSTERYWWVSSAY